MANDQSLTQYKPGMKHNNNVDHGPIANANKDKAVDIKYLSQGVVIPNKHTRQKAKLQKPKFIFFCFLSVVSPLQLPSASFSTLDLSRLCFPRTILRSRSQVRLCSSLGS